MLFEGNIKVALKVVATFDLGVVYAREPHFTKLLDTSRQIHGPDHNNTKCALSTLQEVRQHKVVI